MTPETLPSGSVLVTLAAAKQFAEATGTGVEKARKTLTALLCGARRRTSDGDGPASYRHRSRSTQLDVSARVVVEGPLHVVLSVTVREYR